MATKATVYPAKVGRYYARFRALKSAINGETIEALTTRFAYGKGLRPCTGPRGGRAYQEFNRAAYYHDGVFYRITSVNTNGNPDNPKFENMFVPINTAELYLINEEQAEESGIPRGIRIIVQNGKPTVVREYLGREKLGISDQLSGKMPQKVYADLWRADSDEDWSFVADFLGLNKKKRRSPNKAA